MDVDVLDKVPSFNVSDAARRSTRAFGAMNERRRAMDTAIKTIAVPFLRQRGFKGTYPHLYRNVGGHVDLLMFQFRLDGSSFIVEISYADPERRNVYFRPETPLGKLQVPSTSKRYRLGAKGEADSDGIWFALAHARLTTQTRHFNKIALKVNDLVIEEAEPWWKAQRHVAEQPVAAVREG